MAFVTGPYKYITFSFEHSTTEFLECNKRQTRLQLLLHGVVGDDCKINKVRIVVRLAPLL